MSPPVLPSGWLFPTRLKYEPGAILVPYGWLPVLAARPERHQVSVLAGRPEHHQASGPCPRVLRELCPSYFSLVGRCSLMAGYVAAFSLGQADASKVSASLQAYQGAAPDQDICARGLSRAPSSPRAGSLGVARALRIKSEATRKLSLLFILYSLY